MKEALRHIVGVQFRNLATVGGTAAGRYGFSDLLTLLLVLPTQITLYKAGNVPDRDYYLRCGLQEDMITGIHIDRSLAFLPLRVHALTETDLPILDMCRFTDRYVMANRHRCTAAESHRIH